MKYISTKNNTLFYSVEEAIRSGLPEDNGLYVPEYILEQPSQVLNKMKSMSLPEIAFQVLLPYFSPDIPKKVLKEICQETFNFNIPIRQIEKDIWSLELYHGPTLAFKDVGARFLARCLNYFGNEDKHKKIKVLVATSGDTGSAVAHGFYGLDNVEVIILYPKGRISDLQERQMTCMGGNISAIQIDGNFDDCQNLVKTAFLDTELRKKVELTSANSINIARFLPQSVYYFYAWSRIYSDKKLAFSVPSGNFGNLTAGLYALLNGLPADKFIIGTNANKIVPDFLKTGIFEPKDSIATISNAMDVGNPSNFARMEHLFNSEYLYAESLTGYSFTDKETRKSIQEAYNETGYTLDPHGAIGYQSLKNFLKDNSDYQGIFLETAHPAKFKETVESILNKSIELTEQLKSIVDKEKKFKAISNDYNTLKAEILEL